MEFITWCPGLPTPLLSPSSAGVGHILESQGSSRSILSSLLSWQRCRGWDRIALWNRIRVGEHYAFRRMKQTRCESECVCWRDLCGYSERMLKSLSPKQPKKKKSSVFCSQKVPGGFEPRQPSLERMLLIPSGLLAGRWEINTPRLSPSTPGISLKYASSINAIDFIIESILCTISLGNLSLTSPSLCCLEGQMGSNGFISLIASPDEAATSGDARPAYGSALARCYGCFKG